MKILIIGNGGRESALADTILRFHPEAELFIAPGNGGTEDKYKNVAIAVTQIEALAEFALSEKIDLTVVGPEVPLVLGIVDEFEKQGLRVFGPNKVCSQFEGSKKFTKEFLIRHDIPTAKYLSFEKSEIEQAIEALRGFELPVVVKADGLAAGKGVLICESYEDAEVAIKEIFDDKFLGAGDTLVIEEFLTGIEASQLCFVDGKTIVPMETARDYKRALDGDQGLNTGGMGGFSPNPIITKEVKEEIEKTILQPIIEGFKKENLEFKGILFIGLMIENGKPKVLEFNVRFGDPETQSILPRLETDIVEIFNRCIEGTLHEIQIKWNEKPSVTVVIASRYYPESSEKGVPIEGLELLAEETYLCHAGTKKQDGQIVTDGGRVLAITRMADTLDEAREEIYREIQKVQFAGMQFRTDIGK